MNKGQKRLLKALENVPMEPAQKELIHKGIATMKSTEAMIVAKELEAIAQSIDETVDETNQAIAEMKANMEKRNKVIEVQGITRIIAIGDPHGALDTVKAIVEKESNDKTLITCVGDVVGRCDGPTSSKLCDYMKANNIETVSGNHENWTDSDGVLAFPGKKPKLGPKPNPKLTSSARRWIDSLPERIDIVDTELDEVLATVVHSIRYPRWDYINVHNAKEFYASLGGARVTFSGHTHQPGVYEIDKLNSLVSSEGRPVFKLSIEDVGGPKGFTPFDFLVDDHLLCDLGPPLLIDTGSAGIPQCTNMWPGLKHLKNSFGTYGVIDFEEQVVGLHRIPRSK